MKNDKSDFVHDRYFRFANYPEYYRDIGYPFKVEFLDVGHAIDDVELKDFSPITLVALTAMKYRTPTKVGISSSSRFRTFSGSGLTRAR